MLSSSRIDSVARDIQLSSVDPSLSYLSIYLTVYLPLKVLGSSRRIDAEELFWSAGLP